MSKWTPGKWVVVERGRQGHPPKFVVEANSGGAFGEGRWSAIFLNEADARLIAAAPEMAELLERANSALQTNDDQAASDLAHEIRALLAKVEGK